MSMMSSMISHGAPFSLTVTWALILAWHAMAMGCHGVSIVGSKQPARNAHLEVSMGIVDHLHPMFKLLGCRPTKTTHNPPRNIMFMSFHWWSLMLIDVHWWSCLEQLLSICCLSSITVPVADGSSTTSTGVACDSHLTGPSHLRGRVLFGDPEWLSFVWKMVHQAILTSETWMNMTSEDGSTKKKGSCPLSWTCQTKKVFRNRDLANLM